MKTATIEEARERLPELIEAARSGEEVQITDSGGPVASLIAAASRPVLAHGDVRALTHLEARGLISQWPTLDPELLDEIGDGDSGVLQMLLDEREESR